MANEYKLFNINNHQENENQYKSLLDSHKNSQAEKYHDITF